MSMEYKTLGDTGLLVSTLFFGTMTFKGLGFWNRLRPAPMPIPAATGKN